MQNRKLGNNGIAVSKIALGSMYFGSETPEQDAFAIVDTFVEAGGNLIDTADVYVGGVSEQISCVDFPQAISTLACSTM